MSDLRDVALNAYHSDFLAHWPANSRAHGRRRFGRACSLIREMDTDATVYCGELHATLWSAIIVYPVSA